MGLFSNRRKASKSIEPADPGEKPVISDAEADSIGLDALAAQGLSINELTTQMHAGLFGIERANWNVDMSAGEITFTTPERRAVAAVQVIGTYDPAAGTWMWGWDHPSVPAPVAIAATRVLDFGRRNKLPDLTTRTVTCSEADAWRFTHLAVRLGSETCAYRGPAGGPLVFMTFGKVTVSSS